MLILTRRVGETLMIGDSVTVTVLGVKGNQVRIGITAPKDVAAHREEIYERIQRGEDAESGAKPPASKEALPDPECPGMFRVLFLPGDCGTGRSGNCPQGLKETEKDDAGQ